MFETEIEQLKKHLIARLPQAEPYLYLHDILACQNISKSYKHSIQAEVDWWIYEEQLERADHTHFDTSAPEFQDIFDELDNAYRQNARFDSSQLYTVIDSAVKVRLNFLCRPRTTLKWFIFRGAPTKTVYEIILRLAYFDDYNYLLTGFYEWAQKTYSKHPAMDLLSVVEFEKIMETIDNDFILDLSPHQFVDMLIPLFEFFHLGEEFTPQMTIPTEALIVFLDDKGVELIAHEIERLLYNEDMEHISQERFLDIVTDIINQIEEQESIPMPSPDSTDNNEDSTEESIEINDDFQAKTTEGEEIIIENDDIQTIPPTEISEIEDDVFNIDLELDKELIAEFTTNYDSFPIESVDELLLVNDETKDDNLTQGLEIKEDRVTDFIEVDYETSTEVEPEFLAHDESVIAEVIDIKEETQNMAEEFSTENLIGKDQPTEFFEIDYDISSDAKDEVPVVVLVPDEQTIIDVSDNHNNIPHQIEENETTEADIIDINSVQEETIQFDSDNESQDFTDKIEIEQSKEASEIIAENANVISEKFLENELLVQQIPTQTIPSLMGYMDERQRAEYIKKICGKDEELFSQLVDEIDGCDSWREAAIVIDKFFLLHKTDHRRAVAISFRTIVQKRYSGI